jgi:hypothetical protein
VGLKPEMDAKPPFGVAFSFVLSTPSLEWRNSVKGGGMRLIQILVVIGVGVVVSALSTVPATAEAQSLYRCGATYQDRPCSGGDSKVLARAAPQTAADPEGSQSMEPVCRDRGAAAQKIMWAREVGQTQDEQLSRREFDADLIKRVYALRGSSLVVRRAIESGCMKELEREDGARRSAAGDSAGLSTSRGSRRGMAERAGALEDDATGASGKVQQAQQASGETCSMISAELSRLRNAQRSGGDGATMDDLAAQVRAAQSRLRTKGC